MYEAIAKIILFSSTFGMGIILVKKIPILASLPEQTEKPFSLKILFLDTEEKIKNFHFVKSFSLEKFLQKLLLKFKFLALKTDELTSKWIITLHSRSIKRKNNLSDDYWIKIKKKKGLKGKKITVK
ncbi:hypothetical protein KAS79_00065 [Candidatus Parcubacteria bacterium]|nr:hypothetical protein [Candidatus Parcubacteria bacterium]